jgi:hypothetical protein
MPKTNLVNWLNNWQKTNLMIEYVTLKVTGVLWNDFIVRS